MTRERISIRERIVGLCENRIRKENQKSSSFCSFSNFGLLLDFFFFFNLETRNRISYQTSMVRSGILSLAFLPLN